MTEVSRALPAPRMTRAHRREAILECATRLFARRGYAQTTLAQIASEIGVTEPLIYKHFPSKEALFRAVFERVALFFVERIGAIVAEGAPPRETLRRIALFYFEHLDERPELATILYQVTVHGEQGLAALAEPLRFVQAIFRELHETVVTTIRAGKEAGEFPAELDERTAAWCFIGNYHILILLKSFGLPDFNETTVLRMVHLATGSVPPAVSDPS